MPFSLFLSFLFYYKNEGNEYYEIHLVRLNISEIMIPVYRLTLLLLLCSALLVHCRYFHRPIILDDELMAMLEVDSYPDFRSSESSYQPVIVSTNGDTLLSQLFDRNDVGKRFKTNLHLPRYLRSTDKQS